MTLSDFNTPTAKKALAGLGSATLLIWYCLQKLEKQEERMNRMEVQTEFLKEMHKFYHGDFVTSKKE